VTGIPSEPDSESTPTPTSHQPGSAPPEPPLADPSGSGTGDGSGRGTGSLWSRLTGARVPQLLGVYVGVSFALLQAADIFVDRLGLPEWTFLGLFLVLVAGVPVTVLTALVQAGGRSVRLQGVFSWRNTGLAGLGAVGVLALAVGLFMGARTLGVGPVQSLVAAGVIDRQEAILIADFQSPTGDSLLAGAITEAFRIDFEQSPLVRVVAPGAVRDGLIRMQRPPDSRLTPELARELALREGLKAILIGEINRAGAGSIVSVRLVTPDSEEAIVAFRETVTDSAGVIPAVDRLSNRLRERIGESLRSIQAGDPLERVSTSSLMALRRYSQGVRAIELERDFPAGIALLEEAVAEDSTFAMAWRKLGVTLSNQGFPEERWREPFTRAYDLSDRLTERERYLTRGSYYSSVLGDQDRAISAYRTVLDRYPQETTALNNLAVILGGRGEQEAAMELYRQALAVDSSTVIRYTNLLHHELGLGEWEAAERTLQALETRYPDLLGSEPLRARLAWARGDHAGAEARLRALLDHPQAPADTRLEAMWGLTSLVLIQGRVAESGRMLDRIVETQVGLGHSVPAGAYIHLRAQHRMTVAQDTAGAVRMVENFLGETPIPPESAFEGAHLALAAFFGQAGEVERGRAFLEEWDRLTSDGGRRLPEYVVDQRADVQLLFDFLDGGVEEVLGELRSRVARDPRSVELRYTLAAVFREGGMPDSAAVRLEGYLEVPGANRLQFDATVLPLALEALGQLHEELGNTARAREFHLRFAELWADADPELQPRVGRARARAEALGAIGAVADGAGA
jgi:eukaryotic-like serine/threonine-protein kinase